MKKIYRLQDLDCAHCAAKLQDAVNKIGGVNQASVDFISQKLTIDAVDDKFDEIMKEVVKCFKKIEPDCRILGL